MILRDLDQDANCAGILRAKLMPAPNEWMCFRIPVRAVESWLLADRERFASFARVRISELPSDPDVLLNPKQALLAIVSRSLSRDLRKSIVPREGSGGREGPLYTSTLSEFALEQWRPAQAARNSPSLKRCLIQLRRIAVRWKDHVRHPR